MKNGRQRIIYGPHTRSIPWLLMVVLASSVPAALSAGEYPSLRSDSPFINIEWRKAQEARENRRPNPPPPQPPPVNNLASQFELRGISKISGKTFFTLINLEGTGLERALNLQLNEERSGIQVVEYMEKDKAVRIRSGASVAVISMPEPSFAASSAPTPGGPIRRAAAARTSAPDDGSRNPPPRRVVMRRRTSSSNNATTPTPNSPTGGTATSVSASSGRPTATASGSARTIGGNPQGGVTSPGPGAVETEPPRRIVVPRRRVIPPRREFNR